MGDANLETWRNAGKGPIYVLKYDKFGNETHAGVTGGKSFSLTHDERLLNQDRAATTDLDIFSNGTLTPVRLLDGDEAATELASNPNLMTEEDMKKLFAAHWKTFNARVAEISNTIVLSRLLDMAEDEDGTVKQVSTLRARLKEVDPSAPVETQVDQISSLSGSDDGAATPRAVTPR